MTIKHLTTLTLAYLKAEAGEVQSHQEALEQYLQQAGNSDAQVKFWMGFCINLDSDEDGDLRSVVATDVALAVMQGDLVVLGGC
ncbi:hypothetical protein EYC98_18630 [Halieaceae bacterium IMCC14734]|uniref:Uncharacterized protein n=1 Tax=Candidatus Litorirhabdus singularis TaxID=2518993 RepID=A0ABT3TKQ8_9GAMM|nr:hypothetical protein [Candidatus Litorirhabdus singularis]MCX2982883.1 hypothetical protein [Candidatus Litorirhabdus singularis]